jgi:MFS family permease
MTSSGAAPASSHPTLQVLAIPAARRFVVGRFFSGFGGALASAMVSYHLFAVTGSYAALGVLGLIEFLPVVPTSLLAGVLADRRERRGLLQRALWAALLGNAVLAALSRGAAGEAGLVLAGAFSLAIARGFSAPVGIALLPSLVPREIFQNATVLASGLRNLSIVAGPITMGFLIEPFGFGAPYALAAFLYAVAIGCYARLPASPPPGDPENRLPGRDAVREGLRFVFERRPILGAMSLDMFAVIFAGATALLPVYAEEILQVGPRGYGLLRASMSIGTFAMALLLLATRPFERPGRALLVAVAFFGLATIVFGLSRSLPLSVAAFVVAGMADQVSMTTRNVIVQMGTPDALRGRVSAVSMIFIGASNELGDAESGFLASLTSATFSVVVGGAICLSVVAGVALGVPELRGHRVVAPEQPAPGR